MQPHGEHRRRDDAASRDGAILWLALCIALCGCGAQSDDNLAAVTFTPLGTLAGYTASTASAVSSDGAVVAGTATTPVGARQAFRWTAAQQAMAIGRLPGGTWSSAMSVSGNGNVIVGEADGGTPPTLHAFRWTADDGSAQLPALQGASVCTATGISADAGVVSGTCLTINDEAFRWTETAGTVGLGQFGARTICENKFRAALGAVPARVTYP